MKEIIFSIVILLIIFSLAFFNIAIVMAAFITFCILGLILNCRVIIDYIKSFFYSTYK